MIEIISFQTNLGNQVNLKWSIGTQIGLTWNGIRPLVMEVHRLQDMSLKRSPKRTKDGAKLPKYRFHIFTVFYKRKSHKYFRFMNLLQPQPFLVSRKVRNTSSGCGQ